jgi:hypothetical protein
VSSGNAAVEALLALTPRLGSAVMEPARLPARPPKEDRAADGLQHRVMGVTYGEQVVVIVRPALAARNDVMHVKDGGALSAEEATATAAVIAFEDASPGVFGKL